jgi:hypothetical protein
MSMFISNCRSGIAQFVANHGLDTLRQWCEAGYTTIQEYDEKVGPITHLLVFLPLHSDSCSVFGVVCDTSLH